MKTVRTIIGILVAAALLAVAGFFGYSQLVEKGIIHIKPGETTSKENVITEDFRGIIITADVSRVTVCPSEDGKVRLEFTGNRSITHEYRFVFDGEEKEQNLIIEEKDNRSWIDRMLPVAESLEIKLFLPETHPEGPEENYGKLKINAKTGNCSVKSVPIEWTEVSTFSGNIEISSVTCRGPVGAYSESGNLKMSDIRAQDCGANTSSGNIEIRNVIAEWGGFLIITESGNVTFEDCDSKLESYLRTQSGNVRGTLLSGKQFVTNTAIGKIQVPESEGTVEFMIETTTGNIVIEVKK